MVRYMIYMSYIGNRYRGAQRQSRSATLLDIDTVQGAIEAALLGICPRSLVTPSLTLSSRTDAGVHALCSTAQVELENPHEPFYDTETILKSLNRYLTHCGHEIRITSFFPVKSTFHVRFAAQSRTYLYRLICPKRMDERKLPIAELGRAWNVSDPNFDIEKVKAATRLFMGRKNFQTFSGKNRTGHELRYERHLNELRIEDGEPLMSIDPLSKNFHYWNVVCSSRSFLYNQVRRIVAALAGIGYGDLTEKDINVMLHVPSAHSWNHTIPVAPPHGLYLKEVTYDRVELANLGSHAILQRKTLRFVRRRRKSLTMDLRSEIEARKKKLKATKTIVTNEAGERYEIREGIERKLKEKGWPFVVDEKPDMQIARISEGLFLSSQDPVTSEELLRNHEIRHVLSLGIKIPIELKGINYYFIDFLDLPEFDISTVIEKSLRIINDCRRENVLVHCNAGVSRSATIVIAYLMAAEKLSYEEAHERVKFQRNCIRPNSGFVKQLKSLSNLQKLIPQGCPRPSSTVTENFTLGV